tara:strand:- start:120 stop:275 length:156 start_codon:yes stop_codon:yes gene_type:complete
VHSFAQRSATKVSKERNEAQRDERNETSAHTRLEDQGDRLRRLYFDNAPAI